MYVYEHGESTVSIAIISDTHGQIAPPVLDVVAGCDMVIHAGDICGAPVLAALQATGSQVYAVRGNNDRAALWCASEHEILDDLADTLSVKLPSGLLVVEHGHRHGAHQPSHASLRATHVDARVIVYGHTHKLLIDQTEAPWVVNPGAAGFTRNHGGASCLVLHAVHDHWHFDTYKFPDQIQVVA